MQAPAAQSARETRASQPGASRGTAASRDLLGTVNLDIDGTLDRLDIDLDKLLRNVRAKSGQAAPDMGTPAQRLQAAELTEDLAKMVRLPYCVQL